MACARLRWIAAILVGITVLVSGCGGGSGSGPALAVPSAPSSLSAAAASSAVINLSWTDASNNEDGFRIERGTDGVNFTEIGTMSANTATYSDTGLAALTTYYYRVRSYNSAGNSSSYTNTANATTQPPPPVIPAAPTNLSAASASSAVIDLSWTDTSNNEDGFRIERGTDGASFTQIGTVTANTAAYSDMLLAASTTYYYRIRAYNGAGNSNYSNSTNATTQAPPAVIPASPSNLSAAAASSTVIDLSWTDASNNEDGFRIERGTDGVNFTEIGTTSANTATYADTGLAALKTYYYRVRAYNTAGDSASYSNAANATTPKTINLPKTGQNLCYNVYGGPLVCAGTGQDGDLQKGVVWPAPRFIDPDGTLPITGDVIVDQVTGLMWLRDANCINTNYSTFDTDSTYFDGAVTWQHALNFVKGINTGTYPNCGGGYTDWRLPSRDELRSLIDYSRSNPALQSGHPFINIQANKYWSSTSFTTYPLYAWYVLISSGQLDADYIQDDKSHFSYVWPVRAGEGAYAPAHLPKTGQTKCYDASGNEIACTNTGQDGLLQNGITWPAPRFTLGTGAESACQTDNLTGLMWVSRPDRSGTWQEALDYITTLNSGGGLCGYADWRLPNVNELDSLIHAGYGQEVCGASACASNADWLKAEGFSNISATLYWTSTTLVSAGQYAWSITMWGGQAKLSTKTVNLPIWPVRGGQ
jgi:fibronectin type 3 domain-containing protein